MESKRIRLLLIEDDVGDVDIAKSAISIGKVPIDMDVVDDGVRALDFLRRRGAYQSARVPELIVLDFNLPRKNGQELLRELRQDEQLGQIPLFVLSTSGVPPDMLQELNLKQDECFIKPLRFNDYIELFKQIAKRAASKQKTKSGKGRAST